MVNSMGGAASGFWSKSSVSESGMVEAIQHGADLFKQGLRWDRAAGLPLPDRERADREYFGEFFLR
jgi:hypothetical protein